MLAYILIIPLILLIVFSFITAKTDKSFPFIVMGISMLILIVSLLYYLISQPNYSKSQQLVEYDKCIIFKKAIADTNNMISLQSLNGIKDDIDKINKDIEDSRKNDNVLLRFFYDENTKYLEKIEIDTVKCKLIK